MGVQGFKNAFKYVRIVKRSDLTGTKIAIDAMTELWGASLGAKNIESCTDPSGKSTFHIMTILSRLAKWAENNVGQLWVFDYVPGANDTSHHNAAKIAEIEKRRNRKNEAKKKLKAINEKIKILTEEEKMRNMFSDLFDAETNGTLDQDEKDSDHDLDQSDSEPEEDPKETKEHFVALKHKLKKQGFTLPKESSHFLKAFRK